MSIRSIIIDDDPATRDLLENMMGTLFPEIELVAVSANATDGLEKIEAHKPDLVFLDIEMPDMNGFQLLENLNEIRFEVIFITAYNQYAIKAIRFSALDYLLKPIKPEELQSAIDRYQERSLSDSRARIGNFVQNLQKNSPDEFRLALSTTDGTTFLLTDEIIRLEADINYTQFVLSNGKKIFTSRTLKEYDNLLTDHNFIRIHKSHLINRKYVRKVTSDRSLVMADDSKLEVATRRWEAVKALLGSRT